MAVNGQCPVCGFRAPLVCFASGGQRAELQRIIDQLPGPVCMVANAYLEMFRPSSGHQIEGQKAIDLMSELLALVDTRSIAADNTIRHCQPAVWARAIDFVLTQPTVKRPLTNHKYLYRVAFEMAADPVGAGFKPALPTDTTTTQGAGLKPAPTPESDADFEKDGLLPIERQMKQQQR